MKSRKITPFQLTRAIIQIFSFILIPGLFITVFSAFGETFRAVTNGTFQFAEQSTNILMISAVIIITAIWGRPFCGFICSFGAMQDLLWAAGKRIPFHPAISQKTDSIMKNIKYAVLAFIVFGVWMFDITGDTVWSPWTVFGMYASPWKGFPAEAYFISLGGLLLLLTIIGSLFIERIFCRYLCPLGAIFTLVSRIRIFKIKRNSSNCDERCRACTRKCPMAIPLYKYDSISSGECINCMKCTGLCAKNNIKSNTVQAISGTAAATVLMGVSFVGTLKLPESPAVTDQIVSTSTSAGETTTGKFTDGTYTGSASGYHGTIKVSVTVSGGEISAINILSSRDDGNFLSNASSKIIPAIISSQDVNVSTVSGATFSSRGIINAVADALGEQLSAMTSAYSEASQTTETTYHYDTSSQTSSDTVTTQYQQGSSDTSSEQTERTAEAGSTKNTKKETQPAQTLKKPETTATGTTTAATVPDVQESAKPTVTEKQTSAPTQATTAAPTGPATTEKETTTTKQTSASGFTDGVYTGSGSGFRGATSVSVTVKDGKIASITVTSYKDNEPYFGRAKNGVISAILNSQSINVSTVSGATYSSNSIIEATAKALGLEFNNPNGSGGGRRH